MNSIYKLTQKKTTAIIILPCNASTEMIEVSTGFAIPEGGATGVSTIFAEGLAEGAVVGSKLVAVVNCDATAMVSEDADRSTVFCSVAICVMRDVNLPEVTLSFS